MTKDIMINKMLAVIASAAKQSPTSDAGIAIQEIASLRSQ